MKPERHDVKGVGILRVILGKERVTEYHPNCHTYLSFDTCFRSNIVINHRQSSYFKMTGDWDTRCTIWSSFKLNSL